MHIKKIKQKIQAYVNEADPWYLIECGAPQNEYDSQVDSLISFLVNDKPKIENLIEKLKFLFKTKEHDLDLWKIEDLAKKILSVNIY